MTVSKAVQCADDTVILITQMKLLDLSPAGCDLLIFASVNDSGFQEGTQLIQIMFRIGLILVAVKIQTVMRMFIAMHFA